MVLGHASQNPFTLFGESEFEKQEKERKRMLETQYRDFVPRKSDKENVGAEIEHILDMEDESQKGGKGGGSSAEVPAKPKAAKSTEASKTPTASKAKTKAEPASKSAAAAAPAAKSKKKT